MGKEQIIREILEIYYQMAPEQRSVVAHMILNWPDCKKSVSLQKGK